MLGVYKDAADTNIIMAEKMLTDAMELREVGNICLDRAKVIAEALACFLDSDTVDLDVQGADEPVSWP